MKQRRTSSSTVRGLQGTKRHRNYNCGDTTQHTAEDTTYERNHWVQHCARVHACISLNRDS